MLSSRAKNSPACSPDGKWVVFESDAAGKSTMWRVPIEGGKPQPLSDKLSRLPVISPDGTQVAMYDWSEGDHTPPCFAIPCTPTFEVNAWTAARNPLMDFAGCRRRGSAGAGRVQYGRDVG
jgi:hypothetical protein